LVERLHRRLLDVIKDEFDRRGRADINSVQALLLYNIGDKELTAGELRTRGYYLGSNVSYNLKKLVELGFLDHQRSRVDRRSVRIRLTPQGQEIRRIVDALYQKHVKTVEQVGGISNEEFATLNKSLHRLERFWTDQILYRQLETTPLLDLSGAPRRQSVAVGPCAVRTRPGSFGTYWRRTCASVAQYVAYPLTTNLPSVSSWTIAEFNIASSRTSARATVVPFMTR
jgi:DNA-binding MarR family transcriptional regulator